MTVSYRPIVASPADLARTAVDRLIEGPVVTSFTSIGPAIRSRLDGWTPLDDYDLSGRSVLITGATSGLGRAAAATFGRLGADVILLGRSADKTERVRDELATTAPDATLETVIADMGDLDQVRRAATDVLGRHASLDVLIHNAGALSDERRETAAGFEATVASQVYGPFLMTSLLLPALRAARPGRVLTMASGGMYATRLTVGSLEMGVDHYRGSEQYARAKRAQVTLNEMWAERVEADDVVFHALHPGWADTPGVEESLPRFHKILGPVLRSPDEGVDTLVWLAADDAATERSGGFWLDRRPRSIHKVPTTRRSDTPERRAALWDQVATASGAGDATP